MSGPNLIGRVVAGLRNRVGVLEAGPRMADLAAEATAREQAVNRLAARQVKLVGTLVFPASVAVAVGRVVMTAPVAGLLAADDFAVTPRAALPAPLFLADCLCLADGVLSLVVVNTGALALTVVKRTEVQLGITVFR